MALNSVRFLSSFLRNVVTLLSKLSTSGVIIKHSWPNFKCHTIVHWMCIKWNICFNVLWDADIPDLFLHCTTDCRITGYYLEQIVDGMECSWEGQLTVMTFWLFCLFRDLGTSLTSLRTLWMSRCGLIDLDGISSVSSLKVHKSSRF